jgi:hypothetical protein
MPDYRAVSDFYDGSRWTLAGATYTADADDLRVVAGVLVPIPTAEPAPPPPAPAPRAPRKRR